MKFPRREIVERIRREYPAGTRVELVRMDDAQAPLWGQKAPSKVWMTPVPFLCTGIMAAA